ncbi:MAG: DegT/DnrJ/EryC1/StrS aminotransferase family protein [Candidatus Methylopumilus sp.]|nr:DegT/DnrJ/EryC1/StrS aminotransferase family protein [Candidatus Methylopumilus sp.]
MNLLHYEVPPTAGLPIYIHDFFSQSDSLEKKLAEFIGVDTVQIECSGTVALVVALMSLKKLSGRQKVIISAYTCPWVPVALIHCGLTPIISDAKKNHFDFDLKKLKASLGKDVLAIIPTHLGGKIADVKNILPIAKKYRVFVIEDGAQALGAKEKKQSVGLLGDIGVFSLGVGKGLSIFAGGVIVAHNKKMFSDIQKTSRDLIPNNYFMELKRLIELMFYYIFYHPSLLRFVFGISLRRHLKKGNFIKAVGDDCAFKFPIHRVGTYRKSIGASALDRFNTFLHKNRIKATQRLNQLAAIQNLKVLTTNRPDETWPFMILILLNEKIRNTILADLWPKSLGVGRLFIKSIADYDYLKPYFKKTNALNAKDFAERSMIVSNSP